MKFIIKLVPFLLWMATALYAQKSPAPDPCGPSHTRFDVRAGSIGPSHPTPSDSVSRVVVFPEAISVVTGCGYVVRVAVDGDWRGAVCVGSYLSVDVDPGKHYLCVDLQRRGKSHEKAMFELTARGGKSYYFRAEVIDATPYGVNRNLHLESINRGEGQFLLKTRPRSESKIK